MVAVFIANLITPSFADTFGITTSDSDILKKIKATLDTIATNTLGIKNTQTSQELFRLQQSYLPAPDDGKIIAANAGLINNLSFAQQTIEQASLNAASQLLGLQNSSSIASTYVTREAGDNSSNADPNNANGTYYNTPSKYDMSFSLNALLGTTHYQFTMPDGKTPLTLDQATITNNPSAVTNLNDYAANYIVYISNGDNPVVTNLNYASQIANCGIKYSNTDSRCTMNNVQNTPAAQAYRLAYREFTTFKTTALDTLYRLYYERMPIKGLGRQAGIPGADNASIMQVDEYMAMHRLQPTWYQQEAQMPPATVAREALNVLSEIRYEAFEQRLEMERMNAMLAALLLASANSSAQLVNNTKQTAINDFAPSAPPVTAPKHGN
jgi:hypothetical protein